MAASVFRMFLISCVINSFTNLLVWGLWGLSGDLVVLVLFRWFGHTPSTSLINVQLLVAGEQE